MKTFLRKTGFILFLSIFILSCDDNEDKDEVNCTTNFVSLVVSVNYEDNSPVIVDSYKVMWQDKDITPVLEPLTTSADVELTPDPGKYIITNDKMQSEFEGKTITLLVTGYIEDEIVFSENLNVTADQCHVSYIDDKPLTITIKK